MDAIDIRYWYYKEDGTAYAPEGGLNLAPRQHARKLKTGKETEDQVYRAVREYREKYPEKIVLYTTDGAPKFGWAVLMAGGSLANIPKIQLPAFYSSISEMKFKKENTYTDNLWKLENKGKAFLFYAKKPEDITLDLSNEKGDFDVYAINATSGIATKNTTIRGGKTIVIPALDVKEKVLFVVKKQ
ncbi:MAG: hypothetical protein QG594_930 [Bacteroidota bacterium]|nr:hypothetical protein [Bacteroidota bacterium]